MFPAITSAAGGAVLSRFSIKGTFSCGWSPNAAKPGRVESPAPADVARSSCERQSALGLATKGPLRVFLSTPESIDNLSDNGRIGVVYHVTRILDEMQY
jgi:hypothetical protein